MIKGIGIGLAFGLAVLLLAACESQDAKLAKYVESGKQYIEKNQYNEARIEFARVLQIDPNHAQANFEMAVIAERMESPRQAAGYYQRAIERDPKNTEARLRLARLYLAADVLDKSEEQVEAVLAAAPSDARALVIRAGVRARRGDETRAREDAQSVLRAEPNQPEAVMLLAGMDVRANRLDEAQKLIADARAAHPQHAGLRGGLAEVHLRRGELPEALQLLEENVRAEPFDVGHRARLAAAYAHAQRVDDGENVLRDGVIAQPDSPDIRLALVQYLANHRGADAAEKQLSEYIEQKPQMTALRFGLARLYEQQGKRDKLVQTYRDLIAADPSGLDGQLARLRLAQVLAQTGPRDEAEALLGEYLKDRPNDVDARLMRAALLIDRGAPDEASSHINAALAVVPNSTRALRTLARAQLAKGDRDGAVATLDKARGLDPGDVETGLLLAQIKTQLKDYDGAIALLKELAAARPPTPGVYESLIKNHVLKSDWKGALAVAEQIKSGAPQKALGYYLAGVIYQQKKEHGNAIKQFDVALKLEPGAIEPLTAMTKSLIAQKQPARAAQRVQVVASQRPNDARIHNLLGEIQLVQKRVDDAEKMFRKAIELDRTLVVAYRNLAALHQSRDEMAEAITVYQQGVASTQGDPTLLFALATAFERNKDAAQATATYEALMQRDPSNLAAANNLAMLLLDPPGDAQRVARAKALADRLRATGNPAFLDTVGWVYYHNGDYENAVTYLEQAVKGLSQFAVVRYHLGMALYKKGDTAGARVQLEQALRGRADYPGADEARATLASIKQG